MNYVKVNNTEYPAVVFGKNEDRDWDGRPSNTINLTMTYEDAIEIFVDGTEWSIICESEEDGETIREEFDYSDFNMAGDITDHRDGTLSIKMGKETDLEEILEILYGGDEE